MTVDATAILQALAALGGLAGIAAIINAVMGKRKIGAEATEIIERAAAGVVTRLEGEIQRKDARIDELQTREDELEQRVSDLEREREAQRHTNQEHVAWDYVAWRELQGHGTELDPPPPLYPPPHQRVASNH